MCALWLAFFIQIQEIEIVHVVAVHWLSLTMMQNWYPILCDLHPRQMSANNCNCMDYITHSSTEILNLTFNIRPLEFVQLILQDYFVRNVLVRLYCKTLLCKFRILTSWQVYWLNPLIKLFQFHIRAFLSLMLIVCACACQILKNCSPSVPYAKYVVFLISQNKLLIFIHFSQ